MAERINPAELEQHINSFKIDPSGAWVEENISPFSEYICDLQGVDSFVFALGHFEVVKVYKRGISFLPQIVLYKEITNRAADLCERKERFVEILGKNYRVLVNPITSIYSFSRTDTLCAISNRIFGERLTDYDCLDLKKLYFDLDNFELTLDGELGITGIGFCGSNIRKVEVKNEKRLIITDLCSRILNLKKIIPVT